MGNNLLPWCRYSFSILLDTGRGIDTETCWVDNVCPLGDLWFGLNTLNGLNGTLVYNLYFDVKQVRL